MTAQRNVVLMLRNKRLGFPDLAVARAITGRDGKTGKPSFGARIIVDPKDPDVAAIDAAMMEVATAQWKENAGTVLEMLIDKDRTAFSRKPYRNKEGKVYSGFEGMFNIGASAQAEKRPNYFDEYGVKIDDDTAIACKFYAGCYAHYKVEFYPLIRDEQNRINCCLLGMQFAGDGEAFGGGTPLATADDFAATTKAKADADDVL
jgi:Protein of unknown function (DUF2815)